MNYRTGSMREKQMNTQKISLSCKADKVCHGKKLRANCRASAAVFSLVAILGFCASLLKAAEPSDPKKWVADNLGSLVELYRHLHQTPELSQKEKETSARMAKELRDIGVKVTTN